MTGEGLEELVEDYETSTSDDNKLDVADQIVGWLKEALESTEGETSGCRICGG